jgi:outer membrane protein TolC
MSRYSTFVFVLLLGSSTVSAQVPLSLSAALDEALTGNLTLAALRAQFDAKRLRPGAEHFLVPPTFEAQIWRWPLTTVNPLDTEMYMFTASQDLPGRGKRALRATVLEKEADQASNEIAVRARDVINQVKQAYADLFVSRQAVAVHQESVELLRQTTELITVRYGSGHGAQQDVLKTISGISRLHTDLVTFEEQASRAALRLNILMNRAPDAPMGELEAVGGDAVIQPVEELQRLAREGHPELKAAQLKIERSEAALAVANGDYKPDFMVGGGYQLMPRSAGAWTATVGMTWPNAPWSRRRLDAAKAEAIAEIAAAKARQQVVVAAIGSAIQDAYIRATAARTRASMLRDSVIPQMQQLLDGARLAYQSERGDVAAVVEVQRMLLDAQLDYFRALSDQQQARADLERGVGADLPTPVRIASQEVR